MRIDDRVASYLGRVLDDAGDPVGTCFQVAPGVLVTAWHVLDALGMSYEGAVVRLDPLQGGLPREAQVERVDMLHDLAVLVTGEPLADCVAGLVATDEITTAAPVLITGVAVVNDPGHSYRHLDADGRWAGGTTRDEQVPLGRVTADAVMKGMSGAPVLAGRMVVGVVSARYNSIDGWGRDSVWVTRTENLAPLVAGLGNTSVSLRGWAGAAELTRREQMDRLLVEGSSLRLPRLSELADDKLGATQTLYGLRGDAPYVARTGADQRIRELLAAPGPPYPFVVVWGTTKAGKSRTLAEAIRAAFAHDPAVVLPGDGSALAELVRLGVDDLVDYRPAVVLLDDLSPAVLETLTADMIARVRAWAVIAATMTAQRRADVLKSGSEIGKVARVALAAASGEYELSSGPPVGAERAEAERLYPGERFDGSIAETLVGARELIARYKASHDIHPAGCAVVRAAIDCRRAGVSRPVTEAELRRLFPFYLREVRTGLLPTDEQFAEGIQWAAKPVASQVALLRRASTGEISPGWIVFDHAVTADEGHGGYRPRLLPAETWKELISLIPVQDAFDVGLAAYSRNEIAAARTAFQRAATSGEPWLALCAAFNLGILLRREGDLAGARVACQQAIDSGHTDLAPMAAANLGEILKEEGDLRGARSAFQMAVDSGHPEHAPEAAFSLGVLLYDQGNLAGARAAWRMASDSGHPKYAPKAAYNLGVLLRQEGDLAGAAAAYQVAIESGHAEMASLAAICLGDLLCEQGSVAGARAALQVAIDSGHADHAPEAALNLGLLLWEQGDVAGSRAA
jgi:tetratricopeptide (TPR) repeat protein